MLPYDTLFGIPVLFIGFGCFILAAIFFYVWPKSRAKIYKQISWPHYILHYFHPLAWVLLGTAAFMLARFPVLSIVLAVLGVIVYAVFINMFVRAKPMPAEPDQKGQG